jgi:4-amino-4-deoxy-L-arabinose transferase-like glycosyltransferase
MTGNAKRTAVVCLVLFALALVVRLNVWQNNKAAIDGVQYVVTHIYKQDARLLVNGDISTFLTGPDPPSDATIIMHPPGYPVFIAVVYALFGENESLRIVQMMLCSLAAVLAFFLARRLFDQRTGIIAGVLTAMSPQFAYHSAIILPDELSAVPVIGGVYFLVRAWQSKSLWMMAICGLSLGLSCWLRANGLLLPVFLAAGAMLVFPRGWGVKPVSVMAAAFILMIAPITLRNYAVFHTFVPLSIGFGTTFVEGLAEMDSDGRTGLPPLDEGVMEMDAADVGRPDYYGSLYAPDGIARERNRIARGLAAVNADPGWFASGVLKRGTMAFRMERVPVIEPSYDEGPATPALLALINVPLKFIQRIFITAVVLPFVLFGIVVLLRMPDDRRKMVLLLAVPLYFATVQPIVHTEYRYLLPAAHMLMLLASVPLGWLAMRVIGSNVDNLAAPQ